MTSNRTKPPLHGDPFELVLEGPAGGRVQVC